MISTIPIFAHRFAIAGASVPTSPGATMPSLHPTGLEWITRTFI
jgi:hypothetical protein